jgi:pseudouridylate synthase / pseudouridine kinase
LSPAKLIIIGSAAVDISAKVAPVPDKDVFLGSHSTFPGTVILEPGGVGRNIAEATHRILTSKSQDWLSATLLVSAVGVDPFRLMLQDKMKEIGMRTDGLIASGKQSAVCNMVLDSDGALIGGVADMDIIQSLDGDEVCNNSWL